MLTRRRERTLMFGNDIAEQDAQPSYDVGKTTCDNDELCRRILKDTKLIHKQRDRKAVRATTARCAACPACKWG